MKLAPAVFGLALAAFVSGCSPAVSIRPLYTEEDLKKPVVEPRIEGEWISPNMDEPDKAGTDEELWLRWKIVSADKPSEAYSTYSVEFRPFKPDQGKEDEVSKYDVRLVPIGDKMYFDAEFRQHTQGKTDVGPFDLLGLAPAHIVGRIWVQQDLLRIALLEPEWLEKNSPAGFLEIIPDKYVDTSIITGSTQELRDLLVRNADNQKALAYVAYLCRPGTDCGTRAAEDALARSPDDDNVLEAASKLFLARGNYARVVALRRKQVEKDPENLSHHADLSEALLFHREFGEARRELDAVEKLVLRDPPKQTDSQSNYFEGAYARAAEDIVWSYFLEGEYAEAFNAAKRYKPDKAHYFVNPILLGYYSLRRLGRSAAAESFLKEEAAKFSGPAEEHILLLDAQGRVPEGFAYADPKSEALPEALRRKSFFGGLRDLAEGQPDKAKLHLRDAASEHSHSVVDLAAKIELERLGSGAKK